MAATHPRAAYRKGNEIWGVDFEDEREESFFENGPSPRLLYRGKDAPRSLVWYFRDQYLVFRENNHIKVVEWDSGQEGVDLLEVSGKMPDFFLDGRRGSLYFAEPGGGRLARVELPTEGPLRTPPLLIEFVDEWVKTERKSP